jgi:CheY-like chemotaxis protein
VRGYADYDLSIFHFLNHARYVIRSLNFGKGGLNMAVFPEVLTGKAVSEARADPALQKPIRILVAEDGLVQQMVIRRIRSTDYQIDIVPNGEEAIIEVGRHHYDLIFMDSQMPVCDGVGAVKEIRKFNPLIPIIIQSSSSDEEIEEKFKGVVIQGILGGKLCQLEQIDGIISVLRKQQLI